MGSKKDGPEMKRLKEEAEELWTKIKEEQKAAADVEFVKEMASVADPPHPRIMCRKTLKGHINKVNAVDFSGDSRHMVSGSLDGKLIVWDAWTGNKTQVIPLRSSWVMTAKFSPSGNFLASGGMDNVCTIHDLNNRDSSTGAAKLVRELCGFEGFLSCATFIDDSNLITGSADHKVFHWDLASGRRLTSYDGHDGDVSGLCLSKDGNTFITSSLDRTVKLWDRREGGTSACKKTFRGHEGDITGAAFHPSGLALVSCSEDKTCRSFDVRSENQLAVYSPPTTNSTFSSVVLTLSGRYVLAGSEDSNIHIWDFLKGTHLGSLHGHESRVTSLTISPNGVALGSCSWDQSVRVWG